jgi:hypothetical protein
VIGVVNVPVFPACLAALPSRQPEQTRFALRTVKQSLTVELVSNTYKFESRRRQFEAARMDAAIAANLRERERG